MDGEKMTTYQPPIPNAPPYNAPGVPLGPDFQRENLRRIQPRDCQPRGAEGKSEQEDHADRANAVAI